MFVSVGYGVWIVFGIGFRYVEIKWEDIAVVAWCMMFGEVIG